MFVISLDELERVKRLHGLANATEIAERTHISRNTWNKAIKTRRPTPRVLNALAALGARPDRILVLDALAELGANPKTVLVTE